MKLKLPKQLVLALLATLTITSSYAKDVFLIQTDATAKKIYESGTKKDLHNKPLGQVNFTMGEDVTFAGYNYTHEEADQDNTVPNPGTQKIAPSYGNIFRTHQLRNAYVINTLKGNVDRTHSLSFVNNTSVYDTARKSDPYCQSYGGAAYFYNMIISDLNKLSFSGNSLVNTLGGTVGKTQPGITRGGAMCMSEGKFTHINEISFTNNTVESNFWAFGGALYVANTDPAGEKDYSLMSHIKKVTFDGNKALAKSSSTQLLYGGALATNAGGSQHWFTDLGVISFTNNMLGYSETMLSEENPSTSFSSFKGGAVYLINFMMQGVEQLIVKDNGIDTSSKDFNVKAYGGGIQAVNIQLYDVVAPDTDRGGISILFENNKTLVNHTSTNQSTGFGGAIYSQMVNIEGSGHVLFKNNYSSSLGGALYLERNERGKRGYLSKIMAMKGDIVFVGNTHKLADSNERNSGTANSIYIEGGFDDPDSEGGKQMGLTFTASENRTIYFYDALDSNATKAEHLRINFGNTDFNGSVVFSGEKVEETLSGSEASEDYAERVLASKTSALNAEMVLWAGNLVLKSGVTLGKLAVEGGHSETGSIFYHAGTGTIDISNSTLVAETFDATYNRNDQDEIIGGGEHASWKIGAGANLVANTIDFSNGMGIDVSHYMTANGFQDQGGLHITATSTTLGGTLKIADNADYYTDNIWGTKGTFTLLDTTDAGVTGDFTSIFSNLTGSNLVEDPYQYKGEWSYEWVGTKLVATWTPLGGITDVNPELEGNIVSNSMWSSASNAKALSNTALENANILRFESSMKSNFWVKGIGDFAYDDSTAELVGYSYQGGGYAAGADFKLGEKSIVGVAFGELMGDNKSELYTSKIKQDSMMGSLYAAHLQTLNKRNSLLWMLAGTYGDTENSMNTHYSDGENSSGSWNNNAYFVEAKMEWRIAPEGKSWTYKPFIGVEYTEVKLEGFTEVGDKTREFAEGAYKNIALPIGIGFEHQSHFGKKTWLNSLSLAYVPDVYREAPNTQATRLSNGFSWKDQGSKPSIHTLRATINSTLQLNASWTAYAGYTFEAREDASYHNVNAGVSYSF